MGRIKIILGALILFLPTFALAAVLFDNGSFSGSQILRNNGCSSSDDDGNCNDGQTIYDQFVLGGDSVVTGFEWHQTEQKPENYLGTRLTIGRGVPSPDSLLHTFQVIADRSLTPMASVSGLGIELAAGTYWLGISNAYLQFSGSISQWSQTSGTVQTIAGRWQGEWTNCGAFPTSPEGGCLKVFPTEDSAFRVKGVPFKAATINIAPGRDLDCANKVPVAIFGSAVFDVTQINLNTLVFGESSGSATSRGPGQRCELSDVNSDGYLDLICRSVSGNGEATLYGEFLDGTRFNGIDTTCISSR